MTRAWQVTLTIGAHAPWVTNSGVLPDPNAATSVLDGMRFGWAFPSGKWPAQPDPITLAATLATYDATTLADLDIGQTVTASLILDPSGSPFFGAVFLGRVAGVSATHERRAGRTLTRFVVQAVGYVVDLAELDIAAPVWPQETADARILHIRDAINAASPTAPFATAGSSTVTILAATVAETRKALDLLTRLYDQVADDPGAPPGATWSRQVVLPTFTGTTLTGFATVALSDRIDATNLPGRLTLVGSVLTLTIVGVAGSTLVVDACDVELDPVEWARDKDRAVTAVTVSGPFGTAAASRPAAAPVALALDSTLATTGGSAPARMAAMYLPDNTGEWVVDKFTWHCTDTLDTGYFPAATLASWLSLNVPVVITGIPDDVNLSSRAGIYAGQLNSLDLTVAGGELTADLALRRTLPRTRLDAAKIASSTWLKTAFPNVGCRGAAQNIDPELTSYDLRLVRSP